MHLYLILSKIRGSIQLYTDRITQAGTDAEKDFYKLMKKSFLKTCKNF